MHRETPPALLSVHGELDARFYFHLVDTICVSKIERLLPKTRLMQCLKMLEYCHIVQFDRGTRGSPDRLGCRVS